METAIQMAAQSDPNNDPKRIPKVGAVIVAHNGTVLGTGSRQADTHAEMDALNRVRDKTGLPGATVYTTLEPCTPGVRRKREESCTSLLLEAHVRKVVIGILDPNQGVCGKGVLELQKHNIEVELFPHELAQKIRAMNEEFVRAQQTLGLVFIEPASNPALLTVKILGPYTFKCTCIMPPGNDIFVVSERRGAWWPQGSKLRPVPGSEADGYPVYEFESWFTVTGLQWVHVVRANELGQALIGYYNKVCRNNEHARRKLNLTLSQSLEKDYRIGYPGIDMASPPRGLDIQASIELEIKSR
jgi:pyrimidine deaminase RibD-like protein